MPEQLPRRPFLAAAILLIVVAFFLRVILFKNFPIFVMADSWEYLTISQDMTQLKFHTKELGEWRLPGYPLFLAIIDIITGLNPNNIVLLQKLTGFITIILGFIIGYQAKSYVAAIGLSIFLAINPVFLLNEHLLMTENLFLILLLLFGVTAVLSLTKANFFSGFLLGLSAIMTILVRANGLFFCFPVICSIILVQAKSSLSDQAKQEKKVCYQTAHFATGIVLGIFLLFAPWLGRNFLIYERIVPFTNNTNLNMLVYAAEHDLIDPTLPKMQPYAQYYDPQNPATIYNLIWLFRGDIIQGEEDGGALFREQISNQPARYLQESGYSLLHFVGYKVPGIKSGRNDTAWWFKNMVTNVPAVHKINKNFYESTQTPDSYITHQPNQILLEKWAKTGLAYLSHFRAILITAFLILFCIYSGKALPHYKQPLLQRQIIIIFSLSYFFMVIVHSITLADYDRFAVPFDWIPVLIICLIIEEFLYTKIHPTS